MTPRPFQSIQTGRHPRPTLRSLPLPATSRRSGRLTAATERLSATNQRRLDFDHIRIALTILLVYCVTFRTQSAFASQRHELLASQVLYLPAACLISLEISVASIIPRCRPWPELRQNVLSNASPLRFSGEDSLTRHIHLPTRVGSRSLQHRILRHDHRTVLMHASEPSWLHLAPMRSDCTDPKLFTRSSPPQSPRLLFNGCCQT